MMNHTQSKTLRSLSQSYIKHSVKHLFSSHKYHLSLSPTFPLSNRSLFRKYISQNCNFNSFKSSLGQSYSHSDSNFSQSISLSFLNLFHHLKSAKSLLRLQDLLLVLLLLFSDQKRLRLISMAEWNGTYCFDRTHVFHGGCGSFFVQDGFCIQDSRGRLLLL